MLTNLESTTALGQSREMTVDYMSIPMQARAPVRREILSETELAEVVSIHRSAFPDSGLLALGEDTVTAYYRWLSMHSRKLAFIRSLTAEKRLAGYLILTDGSPLRAFVIEHAGRLMLAGLLHPLALLRQIRMTLRRRSNGPPSQGAPLATLLVIAVHPDFWGQGLGRSMERQAQQAAVAAGYKGMALEVYASNAQAIGFYEAAGWRKTDSSGRTVHMVKRWA